MEIETGIAGNGTGTGYMGNSHVLATKARKTLQLGRIEHKCNICGAARRAHLRTRPACKLNWEYNGNEAGTRNLHQIAIYKAREHTTAGVFCR